MTQEEQRRFRALAQEVERLQRENARLRSERDRAQRQAKSPAWRELVMLKAQLSTARAETARFRIRLENAERELKRFSDYRGIEEMYGDLWVDERGGSFFTLDPYDVVSDRTVELIRSSMSIKSKKARMFLALSLGEAFRRRVLENVDIPF